MTSSGGRPNAGLLYERDLFGDLSSRGYIPAGSRVAGPDDSIPDITIQNSAGTQAGVELKLQLGAAFGSQVLHFNYSQVNIPNATPWYIPTVSPGTTNALMAQFARDVNLIDIVNSTWWTNNIVRGQHYVPYGATDERGGKAAYLSTAPPRPARNAATQYQSDRDNLSGGSGFWVTIPSSTIRDYYTSKSSYYIQIGGGKGLYWMGGQDPLNIQRQIPLFNPGRSRFRVRVQPKGGIAYSIQFAIYIQQLASSPLTLGDSIGTGRNYRGLLPSSNLSFL
jgi:hypothetical protein